VVHEEKGLDVREVPSFPLGRKHVVQKLLHYASFYLVLFFKLLLARQRPDVIVALTTPPYLGLLASVVAKLRGCRSVDWVMDLYPDVMRAHGMLSEQSRPYRLLQGVSAFYLRRSALVVTLGPDMAARVRDYYHGKYVPSLWVPLWASRGKDVSPELMAEYREDRQWDMEKVVFLYSGNMGLGHLFDELCMVIAQRGPQGDGAKWVFCGQGARHAQVADFVSAHSDHPVEMIDSVDEALLDVHLAAGDVHLASLDPAWDGCMVPSKLQGSFAAGRPVLLVGSRTSSLARWILESGGGWVVEAGDVRGLHEAVEIAMDPTERSDRGRRALAFARKTFDRETNCKALEEGIVEAVGRSETHRALGQA
jgi:glycosyltransferase involved in cell wall biosynthesis